MILFISILERQKTSTRGQGTTTAEKVLAVSEMSNSTMTHEMNNISQTSLYVKGLKQCCARKKRVSLSLIGWP